MPPFRMALSSPHEIHRVHYKSLISDSRSDQGRQPKPGAPCLASETRVFTPPTTTRYPTSSTQLLRLICSVEVAAEGHAFRRATNHLHSPPILSGVPQPHHGTSTKDDALTNTDAPPTFLFRSRNSGLMSRTISPRLRAYPAFCKPSFQTGTSALQNFERFSRNTLENTSKPACQAIFSLSHCLEG